jgi:hypothetical protein
MRERTSVFRSLSVWDQTVLVRADGILFSSSFIWVACLDRSVNKRQFLPFFRPFLWSITVRDDALNHESILFDSDKYICSAIETSWPERSLLNAFPYVPLTATSEVKVMNTNMVGKTGPNTALSTYKTTSALLVFFAVIVVIVAAASSRWLSSII